MMLDNLSVSQRLNGIDTEIRAKTGSAVETDPNVRKEEFGCERLESPCEFLSSLSTFVQQ